MSSHDWSFLGDLSERVVALWLADDAELGFSESDSLLPAHARSTGWLGRPAASTSQVADAQARLGCELPRSYRSFLAIANGWHGCAAVSVPHGLCNLDSTDDIDWFRTRDAHVGRLDSLRAMPATSDDFTIDVAHLEAALLIGESDGNECILLNPRRQDDGEWQVITYDKECGFDFFGNFHAFMKSLLEQVK